ncbi:MAG: hypothetical protein ACP5Q0_01555, partial [Halothiobacillus sp.]
LVGLIIIMALAFPKISNRFLHLAPVALFFIILLILPLALNLTVHQINPPYVQDMLADRAAYFGWGWYAPLAVFLGLLLFAAFKRRIALVSIMVPLALSFSFMVNARLLPIVAQLQQGPIKTAGLIARDLPGPALMVGMNTPSFGVYAGKILKKGKPEPGDLVLSRARDAATLNAQILFAQGGVVLLRMR